MTQPDFGAFAPKGMSAWCLARSRALPSRRGANGLWLSLLARLSGAKRDGATFDMVVFGDQRARLRPFDNLSEKRVLLTPNLWDQKERAYLAQAIADGTTGKPFTFVDVGANAGLYSLSVRAAAARAGRSVRLVAVEPEPDTRARLAFNLEASGAGDATILPWAITKDPGPVDLFTNPHNRGETSLTDQGLGAKLTVDGHPLGDALDVAAPDRAVDALKIDIEGAEGPAFEGLFETHPEDRWPRLILMESKADEQNQPVLRRCLDAGYRVDLDTRLNVVLRRR